MKPYLHLCLTLLIIFTYSACEAQPQRELFNVLSGKDKQSPLLLTAEATSPYEATYQFNELVFCDSTNFSCKNNFVKITSVVPFEKNIIITFDKPLIPGKRIEIEGRVADAAGNTLTFTAGVWGYNDRIPSLLINEFTTRGSSNNPDRVELLAQTDGNLAGVTLYDGVASAWDSECILPDFEVKAGDYIVIQYNKELSGEHPIEFDGGTVGLGANNGVISLYNAPYGTILDAVVYSNRTSDSDTNYGGFGTHKVLQRIQELELTHLWQPHPITPETAIDSTYSTATRSFCRQKGANTSSKYDWYIVPTSKFSFGKPNSTEVYNP